MIYTIESCCTSDRVSFVLALIFESDYQITYTFLLGTIHSEAISTH